MPARIRSFCAVPVTTAARLVRALRRAALASRVEIHERSPVLAIHPGFLVTSRTRLRASEIVVATNAWAAGWRPLARLLRPFGSTIVLTEPAPHRLAEIGWTKGESVVDGRTFLDYFRATEDGGAIMGLASKPIDFAGRVGGRLPQDRALAGRAEAGLRALLPALADVRIERARGRVHRQFADVPPLVGTLPKTRIHYAVGSGTAWGQAGSPAGRSPRSSSGSTTSSRVCPWWAARSPSSPLSRSRSSPGRSFAGRWRQSRTPREKGGNRCQGPALSARSPGGWGRGWGCATGKEPQAGGLVTGTGENDSCGHAAGERPGP